MEDRSNLVDDAGRKFAEEAAGYMAHLHAVTRELVRERDDAIAEAERMKMEAEAGFQPRYEAEKRECLEHIRLAAEKWAEQSEHPENIKGAFTSYTNGLVRTNGGMPGDKPEDVLRLLQWQEEARLGDIEARRKSKIYSRWMRT